MVTKTAREIDEMKWLISIGQLPADAIELHIEQEYQQTFGQNYKTDADGQPIEHGRGSKAQPTRGSIDAYIKNQMERRAGGPEPGYDGNLEADGSKSGSATTPTSRHRSSVVRARPNAA